MITIKSASNGAIVKYSKETVIYKFDEDNKEELIEMLYDILQEFDNSTKHDKARIRIKLEHGYCYECTDKNCQICGEE